MPAVALELNTPPVAYLAKVSPTYMKSASNGDGDDRMMLDLFDVVYDTCCRRG